MPAEDRALRPRIGPLASALAGVVVGLAGIGVLAATGWSPESEKSAMHGPRGGGPTGVERTDADRFLAAWRRSRMGTWAVESKLTRRTAAGGVLTIESFQAQRPPDRVLYGGGTVVARQGDQLVACGTPAGRGQPACRRSATTESWADEVDREMEVLAGYLSGLVPLYRVTDEGRGCFLLEQARVLPSPPYGERARFCFDAETGAPVLTEIVRVEGRDLTRAVRVRGKVTDADLRLPADASPTPA